MRRLKLSKNVLTVAMKMQLNSSGRIGEAESLRRILRELREFGKLDEEKIEPLWDSAIEGFVRCGRVTASVGLCGAGLGRLEMLLDVTRS